MSAFSRGNRTHILLVPGFGGFDSLGNVAYYAGITPLFSEWKESGAKPPVVLHYFDNLPTAAVATRASRLRAYMAKRIARGEILEEDAVILVGHSTGGLDIRQFLKDLHELKTDSVTVDVGRPVRLETIRKCVRGVVFLSVPHWGTNIADWVRSHPVWRSAIVAHMRLGAAGADSFALEKIEPAVLSETATLTGCDIFLALQDALTEANEHYPEWNPGPTRKAEAREAAAQLGLYLRHIASDFYVIDDLTSRPPAERPFSPAHVPDEERRAELQQWGYPTLSFATVSASPFRFAAGLPAPTWDLTDPWTYPEFAKDPELSAGTDLAYRACYRACAGGPFEWPKLAGTVTRTLTGDPPPSLQLWDNDGIVNTASMLWPAGDVVLVAADHLDIVGHFDLVKAIPGGGRRYCAYDTLKSTPRFAEGTFKQVWNEVFDFCVTAAGAPVQARHSVTA